jgi:hypothetical protein
MTRKTVLSTSVLTLALGLAVAGSAHAADQPKQEAMKYEEAEKLVAAHIATFDDLDFNVFSGRKWADLGQGEWTAVIGVMDEEYLFWDNQEFMKEIGLGK